ncbi:EamA family transporter RarD [soil metagenome]
MSSSLKAGYLYGLVAYLLWGLVPLYFYAVKSVPGLEILANRIVWSVFLMAALTYLTGGGPALRDAIRNRKLILTMLLSGSLLAVNWYLYIYATTHKKVNEASLGYYMMPLVNAFLATIFLKEKLRPAHYPALLLVAIGVSIPFIVEGDFPWIAVSVCVTFGFYGLVRKMAPVDSLTGLTLETLLLFVPSTGFLLYLWSQGRGHFDESPRITALLMFGGVVTVVPLLTFTLSIRRLPLLAVNFIQFLSPTMQLLLSEFVLDEHFGNDRWAAIGCVWFAVAIFITDAVMQAKQRHAANRASLVLNETEAEAR